jgi:hypothetical protein
LDSGDEPSAGFFLSHDRHQAESFRPRGAIRIPVSLSLPTRVHQCHIRPDESRASFQNRIEIVSETPNEQPRMVLLQISASVRRSGSPTPGSLKATTSALTRRRWRQTRRCAALCGGIPAPPIRTF